MTSFCIIAVQVPREDLPLAHLRQPQNRPHSHVLDVLRERPLCLLMPPRCPVACNLMTSPARDHSSFLPVATFTLEPRSSRRLSSARVCPLSSPLRGSSRDCGRNAAEGVIRSARHLEGLMTCFSLITGGWVKPPRLGFPTAELLSFPSAWMSMLQEMLWVYESPVSVNSCSHLSMHIAQKRHYAGVFHLLEISYVPLCQLEIFIWRFPYGLMGVRSFVFSVFLFSGTTKWCSRLVLDFPCSSPGIKHSSEEPF